MQVQKKEIWAAVRRSHLPHHTEPRHAIHLDFSSSHLGRRRSWRLHCPLGIGQELAPLAKKMT